MPRTTDPHYLSRCRRIRQIWCERQMTFAYLSFRDQRVLHEYYQPAIELSDLALLAHRRRISREQPSLPQRAGRAYARLVHVAQYVPVTATRPRRNSERQLTIRSLARPTLDLERIARSVFAMAMARAEAEIADLPTVAPPLPELEAPAAPSTSPPPPPQLPAEHPVLPGTPPRSDPSVRQSGDDADERAEESSGV